MTFSRKNHQFRMILDLICFYEGFSVMLGKKSMNQLKILNESWLCFVRDWAGIQWFAQFSVYFPAAASYHWSLIAWLICPAGVSVWDRCNLNIHGWLLRNTNQGLKGCKLVFLLNSQMILSNLFVWITQLHLSPAARIKTTRRSILCSDCMTWVCAALRML